MQYIGHIRINSEVIKVLVRPFGYGVAIKIRATGRNGRELTDESAYLKGNPKDVARLRSGETIRL